LTASSQVLITPNLPSTVARSLTSSRYLLTNTPTIPLLRCLKNPTELAGLERAYLRDATAMVRWLAWLDEKINTGYEIEEYQAAQRLVEFRKREELYVGLAYEGIVASGENAALPHYTPPRVGSRVIDRQTPFLVLVSPSFSRF
jgi:Xaa-Pro aminopeptidase